MIVKTYNFSETKDLAANFAKNLKGGDVLCLYGDLGSGKTTFVQGIAQAIGIRRRIISPTFIIVRTYKINKLNFYHIDLYRTKNIDDLKGLGIDEILLSDKNIVAIEWADKLGKLLPKKRIDINFLYQHEDIRKIRIENHG